MSVYTELKGFSNIGENLLDDQLRANLISYFNWSLLNKGNFHNVRIPASGQYGGSKETLSLIKDERYTNGQVWQAFRNNWVWESGLTCSTQPIAISGVYVNGTFYSSATSGTYSHYIDYPRGRVVFNTAIPTTSVVKAEYSYKYINVTDANEVPFIRQLQNGSFRLDSSTFASASSGEYAISPDKKIQTPAIAIDVTSNVTFEPYQLGGGQYTRTKVICHVMADSEKTATKIATILAMQNEKGIYTFDVNQISNNNLSPLNYRGSIASGALTHPQMVDRFTWRKLGITKVTPQEGAWLDSIYYVPVSFRAEVILNNI